MAERANRTTDGATTKERGQLQRSRQGASGDLGAQALLQRSLADPTGLHPKRVLNLQRVIGNRATRRLLQAKMVLGPANDPYEQEAERTAKQDVRGVQQPALQREMDEEETIQTSRYADAVADLERSVTPPAAGSSRVQRDEIEDDELQAAPHHGLEGGDVNADVARSIQSAKGGGQPLQEGVRLSMEQGFGADFSGVRVHTGGQADALNRSLNARAFTTGNDIFFGKGQYNPGSTGGQELEGER